MERIPENLEIEERLYNEVVDDTEEETAQAVETWYYWTARGYRF